VRYIPRRLADVLRQATRHFPAVVVTGPRRAGKTTLLRELFPAAQYVLLEDPDIQGRVRSDPRAFIEEIRPPVIFDEIQNAPELLNYVRTLIDGRPRRMGQWLFTGSQEAPLMRRNHRINGGSRCHPSTLAIEHSGDQVCFSRFCFSV